MPKVLPNVTACNHQISSRTTATFCRFQVVSIWRHSIEALSCRKCLDERNIIYNILFVECEFDIIYCAYLQFLDIYRHIHCKKTFLKMLMTNIFYLKQELLIGKEHLPQTSKMLPQLDMIIAMKFLIYL